MILPPMLEDFLILGVFILESLLKNHNIEHYS